MKIIVGDYTKASTVFKSLCLVDTSFKYISEHFAGVIKKTKTFVDEYSIRVFDLGQAQNTPRFIYFPHEISEVKNSCQQITELADKKGYDRILIPMPGNYAEISSELESLDDRFTIITDNADYILTSGAPSTTTEEPPKILECSSKGDSRFSALYAQVEYNGKTCTIEKHYQDSKRFRNGEGAYLKMTNPKGQNVDAGEVFGTIYEPGILTPFYKYLWYKYFQKNAYLLEYAKEFDDYTDAFRGKSINCQADVIREMIREPEKFMADVNIIVGLEPELQASMQLPENFMNETITGEVVDLPTAVCVTGHRPNDLFGYNDSAKYTQLQNKIYVCLTQFTTQFGVTRFISGGAQGADQLFFWVTEYLKTTHPHAINDVFVPFKGQEMPWSDFGKFGTTEYHQMLATANNVKYVDTSFEINSKTERNDKVGQAMKDRNVAMVNESDYVLGIYKGTVEDIKSTERKSGGTLHCLREAYKRGKKIVVINPFTLETFKLNF